MIKPNGEVAEWLKAPVSKTGRLVRASGVQISPSPPKFEKSIEYIIISLQMDQKNISIFTNLLLK